MVSDEIHDRLDEIARLLSVQIKRDTETQGEAIQAMYAAGIRPSRIADLLGTTTNTVNVSVSRVKSAKKG